MTHYGKQAISSARNRKRSRSYRHRRDFKLSNKCTNTAKKYIAKTAFLTERYICIAEFRYSHNLSSVTGVSYCDRTTGVESNSFHCKVAKGLNC